MDLVRDDEGGIVVNAVHAGVGARAGALAMHVKPVLGTAAFPLGAVAAQIYGIHNGWGEGGADFSAIIHLLRGRSEA